MEDFEAAQALVVRRAAAAQLLRRDERPTRRQYVLRGRLWCGLCGRKMQGNFDNDRPHYRCRYASEYASANHVAHPTTIHVREDLIVPRLDGWLAKFFAPHRQAETVAAMAAASGVNQEAVEAVAELNKQLVDCDRRLATYWTLLDEGADARVVAGWIRDVETERLGVQARTRSLTPGFHR